MDQEIESGSFPRPRTQTEPAKLKFAGLLPRASALAIDLLVFAIIFFPITRLIKGVWLMSPADHRWANGLFITDPICIAFLVFMLAYFVLLEGVLGATLGKSLMGLRVVAADGSPASIGQALARNLARLVDGLPAFSLLGIYLILRSEDHSRVGDRWAKTRVVLAEAEGSSMPAEA